MARIVQFSPFFIPSNLLNLPQSLPSSPQGRGEFLFPRPLSLHVTTNCCYCWLWSRFPSVVFAFSPTQWFCQFPSHYTCALPALLPCHFPSPTENSTRPHFAGGKTIELCALLASTLCWQAWPVEPFPSLVRVGQAFLLGQVRVRNSSVCLPPDYCLFCALNSLHSRLASSKICGHKPMAMLSRVRNCLEFACLCCLYGHAIHPRPAGSHRRRHFHHQPLGGLWPTIETSSSPAMATNGWHSWQPGSPIGNWRAPPTQRRLILEIVSCPHSTLFCGYVLSQ